MLSIDGFDRKTRDNQAKLIVERLKKASYKVHYISLPRLDKKSSYFIDKQLNGLLPSSIDDPYTSSLYYALDKMASVNKIREYISSGHIVCVSGYNSGDRLIQSQKIDNRRDRSAFHGWLDQLEQGMFKIPRANLNLVLDSSDNDSQKSILRDFIDDSSQSSTIVYDTENGQRLSMLAINNRIWEEIQPMLNRFFSKNKVVSSKADNGPSNSIFAPNDNNLGNLNADLYSEKLVVDICRQDDKLVFSIKNVSLALASSLSEAANLRLNLNIPNHIKPNLSICNDLEPSQRQAFAELCEKLITTRARLLNQLDEVNTEGQFKEYISKLTTPLYSVISIEPQDLSIDQVTDIYKLAIKTDSAEAKQIAEQIITQLKSVQVSTEIDSNINLSVGYDESLTDIKESLIPLKGSDNHVVQLVDYWPKNELDLLPSSLYSDSTLSYNQIRSRLSTVNYKERREVLAELLKNGDRIRGGSYTFDILCDYDCYQQLTSLFGFENAQIQASSPFYSYTTPDTVSDPYNIDLYQECFDISNQIYDLLNHSKSKVSSYGVLVGHKTRLNLTLDSKDINKLTPSTRNQALNTILAQMKQEISSAHPFIGSLN